MSTVELVPTADLPKVTSVAPADSEAKARIAGADQAMKIPFGLLDMGADNVRDAAATDIYSLASSIRRLGLVQALGVEPSPVEGRWLVSDGHRRLLALAALGLEPDDPVPVTPLTSTEESPVTRVLRMLAGNLEREDLSPIDEAHVVARLAAVYEMNHEQIGEAMGGWNRKTVALRLALLELPAEAQALVHTGEFGVEGAQEVGRLIRDGAPSSITAGLIKSRANHAEAMREWDRWRNMKALAAMSDALESRGFAVVSHFSHVPTRSGYEAVAKTTLKLDKPADCKGLDPAKVDTVKEPNGKRRPVLVVQRGIEGVAVWTVANRKSVVYKSPGEAVADWQVKRLALDTMEETRLKRAEALVANGPGDLNTTTALRLAASVALSQYGDIIRARRLARLVGLPLLPEPEDGEELSAVGLDWPATVTAWLAEASTQAKLKHLIWAVTLCDAAVNLGAADGLDDAGTELAWFPHVTHAMGAGIGEPLPLAQWEAVLAKARTKLQTESA